MCESISTVRTRGRNLQPFLLKGFVLRFYARLCCCLCAKRKEDDRAMPSVAICRCKDACVTIVRKGRCPVFQCETKAVKSSIFLTMMRLLYNLRGFKMILKRHLNQTKNSRTSNRDSLWRYFTFSKVERSKTCRHVDWLTGSSQSREVQTGQPNPLIVPKIKPYNTLYQNSSPPIHCTKNQAYNSSQKSAAIFCSRCLFSASTHVAAESSLSAESSPHQSSSYLWKPLANSLSSSFLRSSSS